MSDWRDQVLKEFVPNVYRLTLVSDPDGILIEERMAEAIRERGFQLIPFEDHVAFRYAYESRFRSRWDNGERTELVVVLRSQASDISGLPYDLLQAGHKLAFSLGDIFPNLSYPVVATLDRGDLDELFAAQNARKPDKQGDNATKDFILRHVVKFIPEVVAQPSDILLILLHRHYSAQRIPKLLEERITQILRRNRAFDDWPIETLLADREKFFVFLQERWALFLDREAAQRTAGTIPEAPAVAEHMTIPGPVVLPFGHLHIHGIIENMFTEGLLQPVPHAHADVLSQTWVRFGIQLDPAADQARRLEHLLGRLESSLPNGEARHLQWLQFAHGWAELVLLVNEQSIPITGQTAERVKVLTAQLDERLTAWLLRRFAGLSNLPPDPPVILHRIPRFLAVKLEADHRAKIALIVVDGLAMDQWLVMRRALAGNMAGIRFREHAVFAWIPSLTSVSRQALFAGKPPQLFPDSLHTTAKESVLWSQFWEGNGLGPNEVAYIKGLGDGSLDPVYETISHPKVRIAGLVVDKVDKIMHGMELGTAGMHNQVSQWAKLPFLSSLLDLLLHQGFQVYLTSDHGNIEAEGCGRPAEGVVADIRGERVRVYTDASVRSKVKERFPAALAWEPSGLPDNYLALLAPPRQAFVAGKQRIVSHGGVSLEEIIVPFISIERAIP